jgi:hypothetical protein
LVEYDKNFLIIGNQNAITYKEIFKLIKENKIWLGSSLDGRNIWYRIPDDYEKYHKIENGIKYAFVASTIWFTNMDHNKRHEEITLCNKYKGKESEYIKYDNFDAINISKTKDIPMDYKGNMGVPITFLHKYNPEQFEIVGLGISNSGVDIGVRPYTPEHKKYRKEIQKRGAVDGDLYMMIDGVVTVPYARVIIRNKKVEYKSL